MLTIGAEIALVNKAVGVGRDIGGEPLSELPHPAAAGFSQGLSG
jgi:hypothetical protein